MRSRSHGNLRLPRHRGRIVGIAIRSTPLTGIAYCTGVAFAFGGPSDRAGAARRGRIGDLEWDLRNQFEANVEDSAWMPQPRPNF